MRVIAPENATHTYHMSRSKAPVGVLLRCSTSVGHCKLHMHDLSSESPQDQPCKAGGGCAFVEAWANRFELLALNASDIQEICQIVVASDPRVSGDYCSTCRSGTFTTLANVELRT